MTTWTVLFTQTNDTMRYTWHSSQFAPPASYDSQPAKRHTVLIQYAYEMLVKQGVDSDWLSFAAVKVTRKNDN